MLSQVLFTSFLILTLWYLMACVLLGCYRNRVYSKSCVYFCIWFDRKGQKVYLLDVLGHDVKFFHHSNIPRHWLCFHKWKVLMVAIANNGTLDALGREKCVGSWLTTQTDISRPFFSLKSNNSFAEADLEGKGKANCIKLANMAVGLSIDSGTQLVVGCFQNGQLLDQIYLVIDEFSLKIHLSPDIHCVSSRML